jgi:hypothetical protein
VCNSRSARTGAQRSGDHRENLERLTIPVHALVQDLELEESWSAARPREPLR